MKLPSGREISISRLADVAEMVAAESFARENIDEAEETVTDMLRSEFFKLGDTELSFDNDDVVMIMTVIRPVAEEISGELATVMDSCKQRIKDMIGKEIDNAESNKG